MGAAIFIGDELSAAGFRLTGIETVVPEPDAAGAALQEARARAALVIMTADLARACPAGRAGSGDAGRDADARHHSRRAVRAPPARSRQEAQERPGDRDVKPASLIPSLQSDALAREIEQQLKDEAGAVIAAAERDAHAMLAQARASARSRLHEAIAGIAPRKAPAGWRAPRRSSKREQRARAQRQAAQAVQRGLAAAARRCSMRAGAMPEARRQWTDGVARLCADAPACRRLAGRASGRLERAGAAAISSRRSATATASTSLSRPTTVLTAGLRIKADQAVLDATPQGLLADARTIAALLLDEIGAHAMSEAVIRWIGGPVLHARAARRLPRRRSHRSRRRAPSRRGDPPQGRRTGRPSL